MKILESGFSETYSAIMSMQALESRIGARSCP